VHFLSILLLLARREDQVTLSLIFCRHRIELALCDAVDLPLTLGLADVLQGISLDPLGFGEDASFAESLLVLVLVAVQQRGRQHVAAKELGILATWN